ncbi:MAG: MerR family transcriptional regulator [Clostridium sp.]
MKIGSFSKKYSMTPEAIRYYVNEGLLVPRSRNGRYDFGEEDLRDMDFLLKLKSYHFSIHDIHRILSLRRLSNFDSADDMNDYLKILSAQKRKMEQEKIELDTVLHEIEIEIANVEKRRENISGKKHGISFPFLSMLACPYCQSKLNLENCRIDDQEIMSGKLFCSCGYHAEIRNGIICGDTGPISPYDGEDTKRNCYRMMSPELLSLVQKAYLWLDDKLSVCDTNHQVILEDCINNYCFCYANLAEMNPNALYIISDKFEEIVTMYKDLIEKLNLQRNILYIAAGSHLLPLSRGCVDYYIDFDSSNEYAILNQDFAFHEVKEYLAPTAKYLGAFFHFKSGCASMQELYRQYPDAGKHCFDLAYFQQLLRQEWEHVNLETNFGVVTDSGYGESFTYHVNNEPLWLSMYFCRNQK